jgi:hypothetical protein
MRTVKTIALARFLGPLVAAVLFLGISTAPAAAAGQWQIESLSNPTVAPGAQQRYFIEIKNTGDEVLPATLAGPGYQFVATFPAGMTPQEVSGLPAFGFPNSPPPGFEGNCTFSSTTVVCNIPADSAEQQVEAYGNIRPFMVTAAVDADAAGFRAPSFEISGAGVPADDILDATFVKPGAPEFDVVEFDGQTKANAAGDVFTQAAGHPYSLSTQLEFNAYENPSPFKGLLWPVEPIKDIIVDLPPGSLGNPAPFPQCTAGELTKSSGTQVRSLCPPSSQVGTTVPRWNNGGTQTGYAYGPVPVYNMVPPVGSPARFGFNVLGTVVTLDAKLRSHSDYGISIVARNISEGLPFQSTDLTFWGAPADEAHRAQRSCPGEPSMPSDGGPTCSASMSSKAFLRLPTACTKVGEGLPWTAKADSWWKRGALDGNSEPDLSDPDWKTATYISHEAPSYPAAPEEWGDERGVEDCEQVPVKGTLDAKPTSIDTETSSGLNVHVEVPNEGLSNPEGIASSDIKKVKVTLPEGMTINPSQADGLGVCSPAQYQSTVLSFFPTPGKGCPDDAKIGSVSVKSPLLNETLPGDVYVAKPFDNPFGSLLALYVVLHEPQRGILIKLTAKVQTDPVTGQITTTFDDLPQQPFTSFDFKFREGARAPLVTPQACGTYKTNAEFTGWSSVDPVTGQVDPADIVHSDSSFQIVRGVGGGPCPTGGLPPFKPGLVAGSINNAAGKYSPFNVRLFRTDAEQEFTRFSIKLPPGISGKLAGVPFCPDSAIEASKAKTGEQELASPSCPKASEVGHSLAGAGVGSVLTYAPGKIYLAGPYNGSALSIAAITAAKVGPFDLGTVVVRQALKVDPETAEVFIDATGSDPIPHIIDGITVHLRDIRAYVDKPEFTLNPTNCTKTSTASTLLGSGLNFFSDVDDRPVTVSTPYQAADCAALGFKPDLKLQLKGGTKRAGHPSLKATLKMKPGMANIARAQVTLPKSEFLDQSHIGTVCTRVQYAKDQCPAKSVYGYARAFTPILDEPLQGPVYLRSSSHKLPDLVAGLKSGKIEIDLAGRIDSVDGQIRSTFETVPDAPVSKFILTMQGGKKGLLENSTNLCAKAHKAIVEFDGQNGKISDSTPVLKPQCKKAKRKKAAKRRNAR